MLIGFSNRGQKKFIGPGTDNCRVEFPGRFPFRRLMLFAHRDQFSLEVRLGFKAHHLYGIIHHPFCFRNNERVGFKKFIIRIRVERVPVRGPIPNGARIYPICWK